MEDLSSEVFAKFSHIDSNGESIFSEVIALFDGGASRGYTDQILSNLESFKPATQEQLQAAFAQEAEQRGYKAGVKVKCLYDGALETLEDRYVSYQITLDSLYISCCGDSDTLIYDEGKWAEILPKEESKPQTLVLKDVKITQEIDEFTASEKTVDLHLTATHLQQLKAYFTA